MARITNFFHVGDGPQAPFEAELLSRTHEGPAEALTGVTLALKTEDGYYIELTLTGTELQYVASMPHDPFTE